MLIKHLIGTMHRITFTSECISNKSSISFFQILNTVNNLKNISRSRMLSIVKLSIVYLTIIQCMNEYPHIYGTRHRVTSLSFMTSYVTHRNRFVVPKVIKIECGIVRAGFFLIFEFFVRLIG